MAKKKKEEKKEEEKHFTPSNSLIECTGCPCGISNLISTTPTVFVKKQPMATIKDGLPASFLPFPTCSLSLTNTCVPAPIGEWETQGELEKIDIERQTPIIEGNRIKCQAQTGIGTITISEKTSTPPPPENAVDKAQNKINKAANSVTKKITEVAQDAKDAIGSIATTAKEAGGFLNNESVQGAISNASDLVDGVDRKKAEVDVAVGNINIRLENLRAELTQLITGQQQELRDLMTVEDRTPDQNQQEDQEQDEEEARYNQDFFDASNQSTVNDFMSEIENDIATLESSAADLHPPNDFETNTAPDSSTRYFTSEPPGNLGVGNTNSANNISTSNSITSTNSSRENLEEIIRNQEESNTHYQNTANSNYTEANNTLSSYGAAPLPQDEESLQALALLNRLTGPAPETDPSAVILNAIPSSTAINTVSGSLETRINEERTSLNASVQSEIDEVLQEIDYFENLQEYQEESAELQEDLDRSSAALDILGDFDAFIDGIAAKHLGKLGDKYKKTMDQLGKNMSRLNDSLRGASFMAGGFKAGDVITHAPDLPKEKEKEEEEETAKLPPPPVLPPPGKKEPEKKEEETEEECTLTEILITKNNTYEYILNKTSSAGETPYSGSLPEPIVFIAGTTKNRKKLTLKFEDLDCSTCSQGHKEPNEYIRDGKSEILRLNNNKADISIYHNDNELGEFIFGDFFDILILGWKALRPIDYSIPINLCNFNKTIQSKVYIDAKWHLLISLSRPSSEHSIQQTIFNLYPAIGKLIPSHHPTLNIDQKDHPGGIDFKMGVGAIYDNNKSFDLYGKFNTEQIKDYAKKIFRIIDFFSIFSEKIDEKADGKNKEKIKKTPLSKLTGVSFTSTPPNIELKISAGLEEKSSNPFFGISSYTELDISSTLLKIRFEINMITFARKHPWIILVEKFIDGVYHAYNKAVTYLRRDDLRSKPPKLEDFIKFKIGLEGFYGLSEKIKLTGENKNIKVTGNGGIKAYAKFSANLSAETVGFLYTAKAGAEIDATVRLQTDFIVNREGISNSGSKFIVDPIVLEATMLYKIQGWKITNVVGSTINKIKGFFSDDDSKITDSKKTSDDEYIIDIEIAPKEPWKLTLYDGFTYPIGSIS